MPRSSARTTPLGKSPTPSLSSHMAGDVATVIPFTKGGRQCTLTAKQQAIVTEQAQRANDAKNRALVEAVRAEQQHQEAIGFQRVPSKEQVNEEDDVMDFESEDDGDHAKTNETFTSVSVIVPTTGKKKVSTTVPVVHGSASGSLGRESLSVEYTTPPVPRRRLVRRVVSGDPLAHPVMMHFEGSPDMPINPDYLPSSVAAAHPATSSPAPEAAPLAKGPLVVHPHIRKETPITTSAETTIVPKRPKMETSGSRGRVRASDFDQLTKSLIEETITIYRAQIGARDPFPERVDDRDIVKKGWVEVCSTRHVRVELEESIYKLITSRASQARGQAKTISKPYVVTMYGLDSSDVSKRDIRNKVEGLLDCSRFIYKEPESKQGIYRAPIIQLLINKIFFRNKTDDGIINPEFSEDGMLPMVTIALILTILENNLDEWITGEHVDVPFTANAYKQKYQAHLKRLSEFKEKTSDIDIVPRLCKHFLKMARKHAKVTDLAVVIAEGVQLLDADVEAAKKEWEDLVLSDEEL